MKLSIKGFAIACGILWAVAVFWCVLMELVGIGSAPFNVVDQFYFDLLTPTIGGGIILGTVIGFVDGLIFGAIFSWIYNKIA